MSGPPGRLGHLNNANTPKGVCSLCAEVDQAKMFALFVLFAFEGRKQALGRIAPAPLQAWR
jgi:hypothetical protein